MIVVGFNGFTRSAQLFGEVFRRTGIDRHRVLGHDAAAALFVDGKLVAAVEEERLSREKKTSRFPARALDWCLAQAGLDYPDVDLFALPWCFSDEVLARELSRVAQADLPATDKFATIDRLRRLYTTLVSRERVLADFRDQTGYPLPEQRLRLVPHHLAHLMCGYYLHGGGACAFLVTDGRAELHSTIAGEIRDGAVTTFDELSVDIRNSIGLLYSKVTRYLGFVPNNDEYKVMGLSAYCPGAPDNPLLERVVTLTDGGGYRLSFANELYDTQSYYPLFDRIFDRPAHPDQWRFQTWVARCVQDTVEAVVAHQIQALQRRTDLPTLLLEGGVGLNCVNNTRVLETSKFEDVSVSFAASDPGVTIGAGYYPTFEEAAPPARLTADRPAPGPVWHTPYLGPRFDNQAVLAALEAHRDRVSWQRYGSDDIVAATARLLRDKVVVGWFQGPAEYGPRALGARSILANPEFDDIQDIINWRVKKREPFRPFAPVVLESRVREIFELGKKRGSPYMTFVFAVRNQYRQRMRGACHVDGTARLQTISARQHPRLAALLRAVEADHGLPGLINTSFNVAGEPIVCTPEDALGCFLGTDLDYLVIEDFLVAKTA